MCVCEELEGAIAGTLDHLCPQLQTISHSRGPNTLQHRALRLLYSIGVDLLVMDAYTSTGRWTAGVM